MPPVVDDKISNPVLAIGSVETGARLFDGSEPKALASCALIAGLLTKAMNRRASGLFLAFDGIFRHSAAPSSATGIDLSMMGKRKKPVFCLISGAMPSEKNVPIKVMPACPWLYKGSAESKE